MRFLLLIAGLLLPWASFCQPLYSVAWDMRQDGTYLKKECAAMSASERAAKISGRFDFCACTAKLLTPQLSGLPNGVAESQINASLVSRIEPDRCDDATPYKLSMDKEGDRHRTRFDVSLAGEHLVSFLLWHDRYAAGAAHNRWNLEGASFDLASGKALGLADLIEPGKLSEINAKVASSLEAAYPNHVPGAELSSLSPQASKDSAKRKDIEVYTAPSEAKPAKPTPVYISLDGCNGCTYHLTPEGLEIVFQLTEVASFGEGNPRITIGKEYLKKDISERL